MAGRRKNLVGTEVKRLRQARGLDQDALAARLTRLGWDCSENLVSKIEAGFRRIIDEEIVLLARALNVSPGELFAFEKRKESSL